MNVSRQEQYHADVLAHKTELISPGGASERVGDHTTLAEASISSSATCTAELCHTPTVRLKAMLCLA